MALIENLRDYRIKFQPAHNAGAAQYSDAFHREFYGMHSIQIYNPGAQTVLVQVSNVVTPSEANDNDWVQIDSSTAAKIFAPEPNYFRWVRFKVSGGSSAASVYMLSGLRVNS